MKKPSVLGKSSCIPNGNMATSGSLSFFPPANPLCVSALSRRGRNKNILTETEASFRPPPQRGCTSYSTIPNIRGLGMERSYYFLKAKNIHRRWKSQGMIRVCIRKGFQVIRQGQQSWWSGACGSRLKALAHLCHGYWLAEGASRNLIKFLDSSFDKSRLQTITTMAQCYWIHMIAEQYKLRILLKSW